MTEIRIHVDDQYLSTLLQFLETVSYVRVEKVVKDKKSRIPNPEVAGVSATEAYLASLPSDSPLRNVIKPIRAHVTVEELIKESGYTKTDWDKIQQIALEMDIPQTAEELIAQLTPHG